MRPCLAPLALLACCGGLDVSRPIALAPEGGWTDEEVRALGGAANCWNLEQGTALLVGDAAADQRVSVQFNDFACAFGFGVTSSSALPVQVDVCPWVKNLPLLPSTLRHEIGHVLNIDGHSSDPMAVMSGAGVGEREPVFFAGDDGAMFRDANEGFSPRPACAAVIFREWPETGCRCVTVSTTTVAGAADLLDIAAAPAGEAWAVGRGGTILRSTWGGWVPVPSPTTRDLNGVAADARGGAVAVGDGGTVLRFDGSVWNLVPSGTGRDLYAVWVDDAVDDGWAVGEGGTIVRLAGDGPSLARSHGGEDLLAVDGDAIGLRIWAVGARGTALRYELGAWIEVPTWSDVTLQAVQVRAFGTVETALVAGSDGSLCVAVKDGRVECERPPPGQPMRDIISDAWIVGDAGAVLFGRAHWSSEWRLGYDWLAVRTGLDGALRAAANDGPECLWVVGDGGTIAHVCVD